MTGFLDCLAGLIISALFVAPVILLIYLMVIEPALFPGLLILTGVFLAILWAGLRLEKYKAPRND